MFRMILYLLPLPSFRVNHTNYLTKHTLSLLLKFPSSTRGQSRTSMTQSWLYAVKWYNGPL